MVEQRTFLLRVDHDEQMEAKTASGFIYVDPNITDANFNKVVGQGVVDAEAVVVNFGARIMSRDAVPYLDGMGLRAGVPRELADLSNQYRDSHELATCLSIVALGDFWKDPDGNDNGVYLYGNESEHKFNLLWLGRYGWREIWWFLAFHK